MTVKKKVKTKYDFYLIFFQLLNTVQNYDFKPKDIQVLASLYAKHDNLLNKNVPKDEIGRLILSTEFRKEIAKDLGIPSQSLANSITAIRKEKLIVNNVPFYFHDSIHHYPNNSEKYDFKVIFDYVLQE